MSDFRNDAIQNGNKHILNPDIKPGLPTKVFTFNNMINSEFVTDKKQINKKQCVNRNEKIRSLQEIIKTNPRYVDWRINVVSWSDIDQRTRMCWGDHWVKVQLLKEFEKFGCVVEVPPPQADITVYLFGSPFLHKESGIASYNPTSFNVCWLYSHPEKWTKSEASKYDYIFCLSKQYLPKVQELHRYVASFPLFSCTNHVIPDGLEYGSEYDIVMVANARGAEAPYGRISAKMLVDSGIGKNCKINIWGAKWELPKYTYIPKNWISGQYYPYEKLNVLYRTAKIVLIDGHETSEDNGFVPMKLFDVFASGGLPIIRKNIGIEDIFGDIDIQYSNMEEFKELCNFYLRNKKAALEIIRKGNQIAKNHTFKDRASTILTTVSNMVIDADTYRMDSVNMHIPEYINLDKGENLKRIEVIK